jgi:hypothetical protein
LQEAPVINLSRFDSAWQTEKVEEPASIEPIPDGAYEVEVEDVQLTEAASSGNPMLKWRLRIHSGGFENRLLWKNRAITGGSLKWVKQDLETCGLQLAELSALPAHLGDLVHQRLEVVKRTRGEFYDIYFQRRLPERVSDDDLPF